MKLLNVIVLTVLAFQLYEFQNIELPLSAMVVDFYTNYSDMITHAVVVRGVVIYNKAGSFNDAVNDFNRFRPHSIQGANEWKTGTLPFGYIIKLIKMKDNGNNAMLTIESVVQHITLAKKYYYKE